MEEAASAARPDVPIEDYCSVIGRLAPDSLAGASMLSASRLDSSQLLKMIFFDGFIVQNHFCVSVLVLVEGTCVNIDAAPAPPRSTGRLDLDRRSPSPSRSDGGTGSN